MLPCCPNVGQLRANCPALADGREGEVEGRRCGGALATPAESLNVAAAEWLTSTSTAAAAAAAAWPFGLRRQQLRFGKKLRILRIRHVWQFLKLSRQLESHNKTVPMTASEKQQHQQYQHVIIPLDVAIVVGYFRQAAAKQLWPSFRSLDTTEKLKNFSFRVSPERTPREIQPKKVMHIIYTYIDI